MKYLVTHESTETALRAWSGGKSLTIGKFFFWNAGTPMQKSLQGLLQSLLYEILRQQPEWISNLCPSRWSSDMAAFEPWTIAEIKAIICRLVNEELASSKFCFFIDGLDEYSGDPTEILDCLKEIDCSIHIKLCLASRPWNCFENVLGGTAKRKLYLEEHTREDIVNYTQHCLSDTFRRHKNANPDSSASILSRKIATRARGLFLWVALAINSLQRGIANADDLGTICKRLEIFPPELEDFFQHILRQIEHIYRSKSLCLFQVALHSPRPLKLYTFAFLMEEREDDQNFGIKMDRALIGSAEFEKRCNSAARRLEACCKGLLEVQSDSEVSWHRTRDSENTTSAGARPYQADSQIIPYSYETIGFLHRTVRDFLLNHHIPWAQNLPVDFCPHSSIAQALLGELKSLHTTFRIKDPTVQSLLEACTNADSKGTLQCGLLDHLDQLLSGMPWETRTQIQDMINSSIWVLQEVVRRGILSYLERKARDVLSSTGLIGRSLLTEAFQNVKGPRRLEIICCLLDNGVDPSRIDGGTTGCLHNLNHSMSNEWGTPVHVQISQTLLSKGADINIRRGSVLAWGEDVIESLSLSRAEATTNVLRVLLEHAADPNARFDSLGGGSVWEKFLDKLTPFRKFPITDDHADMIEEFLRHGADPFVSRLGPLRNFSLMNVIERMFPPIHSSRLRKVVSQEIDHHRSRALYSRKREHSQGEAMQIEEQVLQNLGGSPSRVRR